MELISRAIMLTLLLFVIVACSAEPLTGECEMSKVRAEANQWLSQIRDYEIRARVSLDGKKVDSRIIGKVPDRLQMQLEMIVPSGRLSQTVVFDGEYQWVESRNPLSTQVLKIALAELTTTDRPFDTSYYLMGTGLLNGEGFPETIMVLLSVYDLKASCDDDSVVLSGPINVQAFTEYAAGRRSRGQPTSVDRFAKEFGYLRIEFEREGYVVSGYTMAPSEGKSLFTVHFQQIQTNQGITVEAFDYTPPAGVEAEDITEAVKSQGDL
jgi:outer membrane lipoprotein-sorting protein